MNESKEDDDEKWSCRHFVKLEKPVRRSSKECRWVKYEEMKVLDPWNALCNDRRRKCKQCTDPVKERVMT